MQLDPVGPIASRWVSVPEFLKKPVATCDFQGAEGGGGGPTVHTSGSAQDLTHMR